MIAKKALGQNYLHGSHIMDQMILALELDRGDRILEVGPGPSVLTRKIIPLVASYCAIEIDHQFYPILESLKNEYANFQFSIEDFLLVSLEKYSRCNKFVGNLPYNISSPILYKLATESNIHTLVCMFAIGSAQRYLANPGSRSYSSATVLAQSFFTVEKVAFVSRMQFNPIPKIDSMVLKMIRKEKEGSIDLKVFNSWIQTLFSYRRKTILNSLIESGVTKNTALEILSSSSIHQTERIENLSIDTLRHLYLHFQDKSKLC